MKANELRIENLVYKMKFNSNIEKYEFPIIRVDHCLLLGLINNSKLVIEPIELIEEWKLKIGFKKINHIHGYSFYSLTHSKINECGIRIYDTHTESRGYYLKNHCKYLHQLQNLYFALTGEELEVSL